MLFQKDYWADHLETLHEFLLLPCAPNLNILLTLTYDLDLQRSKVIKTLRGHISKTAGPNVTKFLHEVEHILGRTLSEKNRERSVT